MTTGWWRGGVTGGEEDAHVAFRGTFTTASAGTVDLGILTSGWFVAAVDGVEVAEGPDRFVPESPECASSRVDLPAGNHVVAVHAHHHGVDTEHGVSLRPFLFVALTDAAGPLCARWRTATLGGYASKIRRLNPNLGWIEWCDTRLLPCDWQLVAFDDRAWDPAAPVDPGLGQVRPSSIGPVRSRTVAGTPIASGTFSERFGALVDDPTVTFAARELDSDLLPIDGIYLRFDLGRTMLGRPTVIVDAPSGTAVEIGYAESLHEGRVLPVTNWANGPSCMLDHYVARGGRQELGPMSPRGCRFVEVHIGASVSVVEFHFAERAYFGEPAGSFSCPDDLLNRVWTTSVTTLRACAEDAIVDCPTRERGQWIGDSTVVGLEVASVAYPDLRLVRRALVQSAQCASDEGFVAATAPGTRYYLATYAAQWFTAALRYVEHTGDHATLQQLLGGARRNAAAFLRSVRADGRLADHIPWPFIDWGARHDPASANLALHLHVLEGSLAFQRWCRLLDARGSEADDLSAVMLSTVRGWVRDAEPACLGYHATVLALRAGLIPDIPQAVEVVKSHLLACFPNNTCAPRLGSPVSESSRVITPYFGHFALAALIEHGQTPFVLDQYRRCWGWFLDRGFATWPEVFDSRWSHCHHWSAAPAWQLSRYVLGLNPRFDIAARRYRLQVHSGGLDRASGRLPITGEDAVIDVAWERGQEGLHYEMETPVPMTVSLPAGDLIELAAHDRWRGVLPDADAAGR